MNSTEQKQANFYNIKKNQYKSNDILKPPYHTKSEINEILKRLAAKNITQTIIDYGAGPGRLTIPLLKKNYSVLSIDISTNSLKGLMDTAKKLKINHKLRTRRKVPANTRTEAIVGTDILHHVNLPNHLSLFYKTLKPNGVLIFSEPNTFNFSWYLFYILFALWTNKNVVEFLNIEKGILNTNHINLKKTLHRQNFKSVTVTGFGLLPLPLLNWSKTLSQLNFKLGNFLFFKYFAYRLIVEAKK